MELITYARPYAKAAFKIAKEHNQIDKWSQMLDLCSDLCGHEHVVRLLKDSSKSDDLKVHALLELLQDSLTVEVENYIWILINKKRILLLPQINKIFKHMKAQEQNFQELLVTSAFSLSDAQKDRISKKITKRLGRSVRMHTKVDNYLIGGIIVKAGDCVIDCSVRSQLIKLGNAILS